MTSAPGPRPSLHLTAGKGWLNDPLGLTFRGGRYHVFFQHVPEVPVWDLGCHWGHATSPDLLHWSEHPVALSPGEGDDGCWSGSVAVPAGQPAALYYTSVDAASLHLGRVRIARPVDDSWDSWVKGEVVAEPPADPAVTVFRDPWVFRDGERWRMLVGGAYEGGTAAAFSYSSPDLVDWTNDGVLASRSVRETAGAWTGQGWECPQLIAVDGAHVLVFSIWEPTDMHDVACAVGDYADGRFAPRTWQRLTHGGHYAASSFVDAAGAPGLIFWIRGIGDPDAGWEGVLSLPYTLGMDDDGVRLDPHVALAGLREPPGDSWHHAVDVEWSPATDGSGLTIRDRSGAVAATLTAGPDWVEVRGVTVAATAGPPVRRPVRLPRGRTPVRVIVDGPVLEVSTGSGLAGARVAATGGVRCESAPGLDWWALGASG